MSNATLPMRVFIADDEPLALRRLARLLEATGRVEIAGSATDPEEALDYLSRNSVDILFLDIQMPEMNGFELLARLGHQPAVVFITAFDQYALQAFEVNSIDYLLKPVVADQLDRALNKLERLRGAAPADLGRVVEQLAAALRPNRREFPDRIASRAGDRVRLIELDRVTHFFAKEKLTYAAAGGKSYVVQSTIGELEQRLDPNRFIHIHRATLLNLDYLHEVHSWFAGGWLVRLKDKEGTELQVARDRVRDLKLRLGL